MNVGVVAEPIDMQSLKYIFDGLGPSLIKRHRVIHRTMEFLYSSPNTQAEDTRSSCVTLKFWSAESMKEYSGLENGSSGNLPSFVCYKAQSLEAAASYPGVHRYLKRDVLVGNCSGDIEIAAKFFENGKIRKLPFAFDESTFYAVDESQRQALKAKLGFQKSDQILLYAGRVTLEKNVHTQIRMLSILQRLFPNLHLVIIGSLANFPFIEFGAYAVDITGMFNRLVRELGLDTRRIYFLGNKNPTETRDFYI